MEKVERGGACIGEVVEWRGVEVMERGGVDGEAWR